MADRAGRAGRPRRRRGRMAYHGVSRRHRSIHRTGPVSQIGAAPAGGLERAPALPGLLHDPVTGRYYADTPEGRQRIQQSLESASVAASAFVSVPINPDVTSSDAPRPPTAKADTMVSRLAQRELLARRRTSCGAYSALREFALRSQIASNSVFVRTGLSITSARYTWYDEQLQQLHVTTPMLDATLRDSSSLPLIINNSRNNSRHNSRNNSRNGSSNGGNSRSLINQVSHFRRVIGGWVVYAVHYGLSDIIVGNAGIAMVSSGHCFSGIHRQGSEGDLRSSVAFQGSGVILLGDDHGLSSFKLRGHGHSMTRHDYTFGTGSAVMALTTHDEHSTAIAGCRNGTMAMLDMRVRGPIATIQFPCGIAQLCSDNNANACLVVDLLGRCTVIDLRMVAPHHLFDRSFLDSRGHQGLGQVPLLHSQCRVACHWAANRAATVDVNNTLLVWEDICNELYRPLTPSRLSGYALPHHLAHCDVLWHPETDKLLVAGVDSRDHQHHLGCLDIP